MLDVLAMGKIRAAIGKAHLLTTKKFRQFQELCHNNLVNFNALSELFGYLQHYSIFIALVC